MAMLDTLPATLVPSVDVGVESPPKSSPISYHLVHSLNPSRNVVISPSIEVLIGRDNTTCTVAFPDVPVLSRRHCRIFTMGRDAFVHDMSSNGTFLNGKVVGRDNQRILRNGDILAIVGPTSPEYNLYSWKFLAPDQEDGPAAELAALYDLRDVLGKGNFATVRRGVNRRTGEAVAIKIVEKKRFAMQADFSFSSLHSEVEILRKMNHPNIVSVIDVFDTPQAFMLVLELVSGGDLFDYIVGRSPEPFTEQEARSLFLQLLEALIYMHSKKVVHRDLKPENVLVHVQRPALLQYDDPQKNAPLVPVEEVTLKVTDFGLAKFCAEIDVMSTMCGTPAYLAPEVKIADGGNSKRARGYDASVDVWSLGVILYILLSGVPPKQPERGVVFVKQFITVSESAKMLVRWMLQPEPDLRADLHDIVNHDWLLNCDVKGRHLIPPARPKKVGGRDPEKSKLAATLPSAAEPPLLGSVTDGVGTDEDEVPAAAQNKRPRTGDVAARPLWQWKHDLEKPDTDESAWRPYDSPDASILERMRSRGAKSCKIHGGEYRVSIEGMYQFSTADHTKQRPVRRLLDTSTH